MMKPIRRLALFLLTSFSLAAASVSGQEVEVDALLARSRVALGLEGANADAVIELSGSASHMRTDGSCRLLLLSAGRFVLDIDTPLPGTMAYDGDDVLNRDWNDTPYPMQFAEREETLLQSWFSTGYWLDPRAGLVIELVRAEPPTLSLAFPDGIVNAELVLDEESALPRSLAIRNWRSTTTTTLGDWRGVADRQVPFDVHIEPSSGEPSSFDYETAKLLGAAPEAPFAAAAAPAGGAHFARDVDARIELRRAQSGHLLVPALVDGEDRGWFILDTGAGTLCISGDVANAVSMSSLGSVEAVGVAGSTTAGFRQGESLTFGPLVMDAPIFLELDLSFLEPVFGVKVAGICGFEIFQRAAVEIDLGDEYVYVREAHECEVASWSPLFLEGRMPCMRARFEGDREGLFRFDSGSGGSLEFDVDTVEAFDLLAGRELASAMVGGVGGTRTVDRGVLAWVELAGRRYPQVATAFARADPTAQRSPVTDGVFGIGLVDDLTIIFDYRNARYAIEGGD